MEPNTNRLLEGRVALVTGASRGIGRAIAIEFARHGAAVAVNANKSAEQAEEVVSEIQGVGGSAMATLADVADTGAVEAMVADVRQKLGQVDILVNNAGLGWVTRLEAMSGDEWDRMLAVNLKSVFNCCRAVIGDMKRRRYGKILCISSMSGVRGGLVGHVHYGASKAGMHGFAMTLARDVGKDNINVNVIAPGPIETEMFQETATDEHRQRVLAEIPLGRIGRPEDVARVALFLVSDWAAYLTGLVVPVCGGMYMP